MSMLPLEQTLELHFDATYEAKQYVHPFAGRSQF